jgi:hypothetical protein
MHAATLKNSQRLQRLLKFLRKGGAYTTRQVSRGANIEAVSAAISELRANHYIIDCFRRQVNGVSRHHYMLVGRL